MIRDFFQRILESPEYVRRRVFLFAVFLIVPLLVGAWILSLNIALNKNKEAERETQAGASSIQGSWQDVLEGVSSVREGFASLNLLSQFQGAGDFSLWPEPERERNHLPLE